MIISFKLIAAAVVLGICGASMSGVMAQQQTPSTLKVIRFEGDFTMILAAMPNAYGVTVGLELEGQRYHHVGISVLDANLTDAMNAIVQASKKYQWRETGGFVEVWPLAGSNPLLETRISNFNVKDLSSSEAFDQLFNLPEVQANMKDLNLRRRAADAAPGKVSATRFSLNVAGVNLRQALNQIAKESGTQIWIFRNYPNGFFSISTIEQ